MTFVPARAARLAAAILCLPAFAACAGDLAGVPPPEPARDAPQPRIVSVVRPEPTADDDLLPSSLYVERDARVTARSSGIIEKVLVDRGSTVKAGDPLAILETDIASRDLEMAGQEARLAEAEYERLRALKEQNVVSAQEFLRAEIARDKAATRTALARAWLERCTLRAPFDGVVAERWAVAGERVEEDDGTPLFRVVAKEPLRARVDVPEERLGGLKPGLPAWIVPSAGGPPQPARIVFVGPAIDPASGTAAVIVEAVQAASGLRLGQSVRVRIDGLAAGATASVRVPLEALPGGPVSPGDEATLLVVADGRARGRRVKVVAVRGGSVTIAGPVGPADQVIVGAGGSIGEGDEVRAREVAR